jgi:hypothetical protein
MVDRPLDPEARREEALKAAGGSIRASRGLLLLGAVLLGAIAFVFTLERSPQRAWANVWYNFLFWTALAQAGVIFGAILQAAKGHWGKDYRRIAEGAGMFLPISLAVFVALYFGAEHIFPWIHPVEAHVNLEWLTVEGVFLRNGVLLALMVVASGFFLWTSLRPDASFLKGRHTGWRAALVGRLGRNWRGDEEEAARSRSTLSWLSPLLILMWVTAFTLLAVDMAMSLVPGFLSVIWGPYYFIGGWLTLLAFVTVVAGWHAGVRKRQLWTRWQFHDLGKLFFAFTIFWTYLWFSQFIVVWYGNIPRETLWFVQRTSQGFSPLLTLQMVLIFAIPFVLLLGRSPKMKPRFLAAVGLVSLAGFWIERYNLVFPSIWEGSPPLGLVEVAIFVGFLGLFGLAYSLYATTFPLLPLRESLIEGEPGRGP